MHRSRFLFIIVSRLFIVLIAFILSVSLVPAQPGMAIPLESNIASCSGNNLLVETSHSNTFGSVRVNGTGPGVPVAVNNSGDVTLTGPGVWDIYLQRHDGLSWGALENVGIFTCPASSPPDTVITAPTLIGGMLYDTSPTFRFGTHPGAATFECDFDGGGYSSCTNPNTRNIGTVFGDYTFAVRATQGGQTDPTPATISFTLAPSPYVSITPTSGLVTTEAGGEDTFTVVLTAQPLYSVSIGFSSGDPTEGMVSPSSISFTNANWNVPQTVTVIGVEDNVIDGTVAYTIISGLTNSFDPAFDDQKAVDIAVVNQDSGRTGAPYVVTKTADTDDGVCNSDCSLREAIMATNYAVSDDTITFASSANGTITLTSELPGLAYSGDLTITGNGTANTIISGGGLYRVMGVSSGNSVTLTGVTLTQGAASSGGGFYLSGSSLTLNNSVISNSTSTGSGGGLYSTGTSTININGSTLSGNSASSNGGAIYISNSSANLTIDNSILRSNSANSGGAIYQSAATVTIQNGTVIGGSGAGNTATTDGGGIYNTSGAGPLTINGSTVSYNTANRHGGGIYNIPNVTSITNSTITQNTATTGNGGGVYGAGSVTLTNSTVSNNSASTFGGGVYNDGSPNTMTLNGSSILNNTVNGSGGGAYNGSQSTLSIQGGSVVSGNSATTGSGGGILNENSSAFLNITDSTISSNQAAVDGDGILNRTNGSVTIQNSCIVLNGEGFNNQVGTAQTATNNWWGAADGPNPPGSGDGIVGTITVSPFLTVNPGCASVVGESATVTLGNTGFSVNEGANANFTLTRTGATTSALTVTLNITQGTGTVNADYTLTPASGTISAQVGNPVTVTIPAGSASLNISMAAVDDVDAEADNTLTVALVDQAAYDLGATTSSTATIPANDTVVTNTNDSGDGSLRQAITNANAFAGADTITFTAGANGTIILDTVLPDLASNGTLTITGNGAANTIISGNNAVRVFTVANNATVTMSGVRITQGNGENGAGIFNNGSLTLSSCEITDNHAVTSGAGLYVNNSTDTLTLIECTLHGNHADGSGGTLVNYGITSITNSTFTNNQSGIPATIRNNGSGQITITHSTISNNEGGIYSTGGTTTLGHTILAGNTSGGSSEGNANLISLGYNIIGSTSGFVITGDTATNLTNAAASPLNLGALANNGGSTPTMALQVGSVAYNAGNPSFVAPPSTDQRGSPRVSMGRIDIGAYESTTDLTPALPDVTISPASFNVNEGANANFTLTRTGATTSALTVTLNITQGTGTVNADYTLTPASGTISAQVGNPVTVTIPAGSASLNISMAAVDDVDAEADNTLTVALVDQAAYNLGATTSSTATIPQNDLVVTNTNDSGDGSLRQALANAKAFAGDDTITFTVTGTISLTSMLLNIDSNVIIDGPGAGSLTITGNNARQVFFVSPSVTATIQNMTIANGDADSTPGGGIMNGGTLTVTNSIISGNSGNYGGGIYNFGGTVMVSNSIISGNSADFGGGIYNDGDPLTVTNSIISGNSALVYGGGIFSFDGSTVTVTNSTLSGNSANDGGGIYNNYGAPLNLNNSIVANSTHGGDCSLDGSTVNAQYSLIEDGSCGITNGVSGNLTGDPALNGDLTLSALSIAINAGSNSLIPGGVTTDLAGNARIQQGTVDMGAYESAFTPALPVVTISSTDNSGAEAGSDAITFRITRSLVSASALTVNYTIGGTATNGTDYTPTLTGTAIIAANETFVDITVTPLDDELDEVDESVSLTLVDAAAYDLGATTSDTGTITDDDSAGITVNPTSGLITNEAGGTAQFTVVLTSEPTANVTIALSSSDTTEGTVLPISLTFTPANWDTAQTVTVTGVDDLAVDGDIAYTIVTGNAASTDPNYSNRAVADVSVTNEDSDEAGITVDPIDGLVTLESGTTAQFTVVLMTQPSADVSFNLMSEDTSEGTISPANVTFTDADWDEPQTITVTGMDDAMVDGNITYLITTGLAASGDLNYEGLDPDDVEVTNNDDDSAGITVNPTSGLVTTEAGGTAEFTVVLNTQPSADVTIGLSSTDTTEGTVLPISVTFTMANWDTAQTVTITGVDDALVDGAVGYTILTAAAVSSDPNYSGLNPADVSVTNTDDDNAGITVNPTSGLVTTEAGGTAEFTVVLNSQPSADVTIALSSSDTTEGTVLPISVTFTTANWDTAQTVTITGVDDALVDGAVGYTILTAAAVSSDPNYSGLNPADVSVTNTDDDNAGITVNPTSGLVTTEGGGTAEFTVVLNTQPSADVTIGLSSTDTTEGTVLPISVTFTTANWDTAQTVTITGVDDALVDGSVGYTILTAAAVSADAAYNGVNPADVSVTNTDDDNAGITVNPTSGLVTTEGGGTAEFTIVLNSQPSGDVTIALSSSDTSEGAVSPAQVTFTTANWNIAQTVTVTGVDDALVDGAVGYTILTAAAVSSDAAYNGVDPADVSVTNTDDDNAGITVNPTSGLVTTEAGGTAEFTVVLNSQPSADVTIALSSSDTTEGTVLPISVTFTTANWNIAQTVTVTGVDDALVDGAVGYTILTASTVSADAAYNGVDPADVSVTNADDDTAGITVNPTSGLVTTEGGGTAEFTVVLNSQPSADVTIALSSSDMTEGTVLPISLTFTTANWNIAQTITVTGVDDALVDGAVGYTIITAAAISSDAAYNGVDPADVSVTNSDDDTAGIAVNPTSGLVTTEAGGTAEFTIALNTQPTAYVTIDLSSSDTSEGAVSPAQVTFTTANWNIAQTVTVTGVDDALVDGAVGYTIITAAAISSDANYNGLNPADVSVTNNDDDTAGITVNPTSGLVTTEGGGTAEFTIALNTQPSADVTIALSSSDTTEGTVLPISVTFTTANWNIAQTVTITGVDDALVDGSIGYTIITAAAISSDAAYSGVNPSDVSVSNNDNDSAGITVNPTSGLVTTEGGGTAEFTIVLNTQPSADVTIDLTSSDTSEGAVNPAQVTFTTANWNVAQTVTVTSVDDALVDGAVDYTIITAAAVSSDPNYSGLNPADVSVTNTDDDSAGITVNPTSGLVTTEGGGTAEFTVVLNSQPSADVTIALSSSDTTEGTVLPISVTFTTANWDTAQTVTITGVDDALVDGAVGYTILTAAAISSDAAYNGVDPADVSVTNSDDDSAGITVNPTSGLVTTEAGGTAEFTVVLNSQPSADVTIGLSSSDTSEGTVLPISLTFTTANWDTAQTVTITGVDDLSVDGNVGYSILTAAAVSSDPNYSGLNPANVSVTNSDDDSAGITVNPTSGLVTTEGGGTAEFTIALNTQPSADVTIDLTSSDTTEGAVSPAQVTFTSANWDTAQTVTVTGVDDALVDGSIGYTIITAAAVSSDPNYSGLNPADVSVTNTDDDSAGITVNPTSGLVTTEAGGTAEFTIVLNTQPSADVTIALSSSDTTEGTVLPISVTFTTANWNVAQTVTITGVDDALVDGAVGYTILTAAAVSSDAAYSGLNPADVSVTNSDDDTAGITVNPTSGLVTTEGGGTAEFTVVLNSQPSADVTIAVSSSDTTEGTVLPISVTFTTANWSIAQTVTVTGVDDALVDGAVGYTIITAAAVSSDPNYSGLNPADVSVTNGDDDTAGITVNPTSGLVTTEAGGTAEFTVVLNSQPTADVTIDLSSSDTSEGTVSPAQVTLTSANWNVAQTVTVMGVDDALDDGNVGYSVVTAAAVSSDPNYSGLNPADVSVTNNDDDNAGITVNPTGGLVTTEAGGTAEFTLVLNSQPTADVGIILSSSDTTEGTVAPLALTFTAANWNIAQTVTVTGVDDALDDGDVTYGVNVTTASGDPLYNGVSVLDVGVTNTDDDATGISINPTSGLVTTEVGGTAEFTIVLTSQPTGDVTIDLTSSDTTEGTVAPLTVTFTPASWNAAQTVTVTGMDDGIDDGDISYSIITAMAVSADVTYGGLDAVDVSLSNTDDDTAGINITPNLFYMTEGSAPQTYHIAVVTEPSAPFTLALTFDPTQLSVDGSATSPVLYTFTSGGVIGISVDVVENDAVNTDRVAVIQHSIVSSSASEYPPRQLASVTINIGDAPPPPPVPTCEAHNFDEGGVVRSSAPDAISYAINCRVLYQNGAPTSWLGNPLYSEANLGVAGLLDLGVQQAVDIFSPVGMTYFDGGAVFCVRGSGTLIWLAASGAPRIPQIIGSYTVEPFPGFTCATLFEPGTLILVSDNPLD